jgi:hypothetical protein
MYRIVNRSSMHHVVNRLSAIFLIAALSLFATTVESAAGSPGTGKVAKHSARHGKKRPVPAGVVFGGVTSAGWPVVIEVSRDGREVVRATMAVPLKCQSGGELVVPNYYTHVPISATGAFQGSGEVTVNGESAPTVTFTNQMTGSFNRLARTVAGTWNLAAVVRDASGATVDHCDSGAVSFTAIQ